MPYTDLLPCNNYSNPGLKKLWILTHQTDGNAINFPLNITLTNDTDCIIEVSANTITQVVNVGGQLMNYIIVDSFENSSFVDERVEARQGVYYMKTLSLTVPKMQAYTSNQIMDFLFNVYGTVAIANVCIMAEDSNGNKWFIGWDSPAIMQGGNLQTDPYDTTENKYSYTFISKSASRAYQYKLIVSPPFTTTTTTTTTTTAAPTTSTTTTTAAPTTSTTTSTTTAAPTTSTTTSTTTAAPTTTTTTTTTTTQPPEEYYTLTHCGDNVTNWYATRTGSGQLYNGNLVEGATDVWYHITHTDNIDPGLIQIQVTNFGYGPCPS